MFSINEIKNFVTTCLDSTWFRIAKHNIITIPKIPNKLNNIVVKAKDKLNKENQTNDVYKIECESCNVSHVG